ncbi:MAG: hypothetical protein RR202_10810 [Bacteroidales bacterium]
MRTLFCFFISKLEIAAIVVIFLLCLFLSGMSENVGEMTEYMKRYLFLSAVGALLPGVATAIFAVAHLREIRSSGLLWNFNPESSVELQLRYFFWVLLLSELIWSSIFFVLLFLSEY